MSKDSHRVQVSNPHCDLDQVTRIPLKLGQYKVTIAIAAACIFIGAGLLPEILYLILIKVVGLELWIGRLDYFQWNFFTGFCYIAALMIAAISMSRERADTSTRLISLPLPILILQVSSQLLCACVMTRMHAPYPFRVSSMDRTALVRPGVYTIIEDVLAVDGGQGQEYRRLLDAQYCCSKPIRVLLERLDLAWGLSGAVVATVLITLIATLSSRDTVFLIGWLTPWRWAGLLAVATRWMWDIALMHEQGEQAEKR
ncbi:uncharacterized protein BDW70DRAFT_167838 [Aspergillus foveolatus]|uniref:uncharacterized protein n=1 Tax=Aspergillus foveolatus TaxID=210207 RepID=UPI003CCD5842